jgi:hypothetical protein
MKSPKINSFISKPNKSKAITTWGPSKAIHIDL